MMLIGTRGKPQMIVSDNEIEFTSKAMLGWAKDHGVTRTTSRWAGRCRTATSSPYNRRMRDEFLNENLFICLDRLPGACAPTHTA